MDRLVFGNPGAEYLLIQPAGEHELNGLESEARLIRELSGMDFYLVAPVVADWDRDLSPWPADPVFSSEPFGGGAPATLGGILALLGEVRAPGQACVIGGYSLAGLFALWAACESDLFAGVAAASPSVWFPGFNEYLRNHPIHAKTVDLSLGDREARSRNPVLASVQDRILETQSIITAQGVPCEFQFNPGSHFQDPGPRTAKAFARVMKII